MKRDNQIGEFEKGNAVSFYIRQVAKKLLHPTAEDRGKVARAKKKGAVVCQEGISQVTPANKSVRLEHIEEGYEKRGVSKKEAAKRAWATVNKKDKGGKNTGSGRRAE